MHAQLPDDDDPPEIIRLLPLDASHDKIPPNKNATPVAGEKSLAEMAEDMENRRFNAVVCERSSADQCDKIAQDRSCVEHTVRTLKGVVGASSDDASAAGTDEEGTEEETDYEAVQQHGHVRQPRSDVVPDNHKSKGDEMIANGDENVKIERIAVKTGNHLVEKIESVYFGAAYVF